MPPPALAIAAALYIAFWLGRKIGQVNVDAAVARASCEVAENAFAAGYRSCQLANEAVDLGTDDHVRGQQQAAREGRQ